MRRAYPPVKLIGSLPDLHPSGGFYQELTHPQCALERRLLSEPSLKVPTINPFRDPLLSSPHEGASCIRISEPRIYICDIEGGWRVEGDYVCENELEQSHASGTHETLRCVHQSTGQGVNGVLKVERRHSVGTRGRRAGREGPITRFP